VYTTGSLTGAARELARYKLYLVGVQGVMWDEGGSVIAGIIILSMERKRKSSIGNRIFCAPKDNISNKTVDFVSDRVSYVGLRGRRCNTIVMNKRAPSEEKYNDSKDSFGGKLSRFLIIFLSSI